MKNIKIVYMGTPNFSVKPLSELINISNVELVITKPDTKVGRGGFRKESPVKNLALKHNIKVLEPIKLMDVYNDIKSINPDLIITCAYGNLVPKEILDIPKKGNINIHASLLPKYRGADPITFSLLNGDTKTGITLMYMDEGMDTGDIISYHYLDILSDDNYETLYNKLCNLASLAIKDKLLDIYNENTKRVKQDNNKATYTRKITREDEYIDFNDKTINIHNKVRALYPNAYINILDKEIKILKTSYKLKENSKPGLITLTKNTFGIDTLDGVIYLELVKPESKKEMSIKNYINGINKDKLLNTLKGNKNERR